MNVLLGSLCSRHVPFAIATSTFIGTVRISEPADLRGKNIGLPHYQMTAALWVRGFFNTILGSTRRRFTGGRAA